MLSMEIPAEKDKLRLGICLSLKPYRTVRPKGKVNSLKYLFIKEVICLLKNSVVFQ